MRPTPPPSGAHPLHHHRSPTTYPTIPPSHARGYIGSVATLPDNGNETTTDPTETPPSETLSDEPYEHNAPDWILLPPTLTLTGTGLKDWRQPGVIPKVVPLPNSPDSVTHTSQQPHEDNCRTRESGVRPSTVREQCVNIDKHNATIELHRSDTTYVNGNGTMPPSSYIDRIPHT